MKLRSCRWARVLQLRSALLDLADTLACHVELLADFSSVWSGSSDAEAHASTLASRGVSESRMSLPTSRSRPASPLRSGRCWLVLDEVAQVGIVVVADRRFHEIGSWRLHDLADLVSGISSSRQDAGIRLEPNSCSAGARCVHLVDGLDHVHGMRIVRAWSALSLLWPGGSTTSHRSRTCTAPVRTCPPPSSGRCSFLDQVQELQAAVVLLAIEITRRRFASIIPSWLARRARLRSCAC